MNTSGVVILFVLTHSSVTVFNNIKGKKKTYQVITSYKVGSQAGVI